jgi:hypothetical protein
MRLIIYKKLKGIIDFNKMLIVQIVITLCNIYASFVEADSNRLYTFE